MPSKPNSKTKKRKTMHKTKKSPKRFQFSGRGDFKKNLPIFMVLFAIVAGILIWRAFAVTSGQLLSSNFDVSSSSGAVAYSKCDPPASSCKKNTNFVQISNGAGSGVFRSTTASLDRGMYSVCIDSAREPNSAGGPTANGSIKAASYNNGAVDGIEVNQTYSLGYSDKYGPVSNCLPNLSINSNASGVQVIVTNFGSGPINVASIILTKTGDLPNQLPASACDFFSGNTNDVMLSSSGVHGSDPNLSNSSTPVFTLLGDGGSAIYQVNIDGNSIGQWMTSTGQINGAVCIQTPHLSDGSHTLTATELKPKAGSVGPYSFGVDTTHPAAPSQPVVNLISGGKAFLSGTGPANTALQVKEGVLGKGGTTINAAGNWSLTTLTLSSGTHTLYAVTKDSAGNESAPSPPVTVTIP